MSDRMRVSVCMAAYNGERYIAAQLDSIRSQLSDNDEIIVVDDRSSDETRARVRALGDLRIRLVEHQDRLGILRTFDDAIRNAGNEIIFLSDQDDLWLPGKVATILRGFEEHPEISLIASAVRYVNSEGSVLPEIDTGGPERFHSGFWSTLISNRYRGCSMAFRAGIRSEILPLPEGYDVLHDVWIGMRNHLSGGKALYIDQPLMLYRRHTATVTGRKPLSLGRKMKVRVQLLCALAEYSMKKRRRAS
jgi:glycosyltransferase involved in cell wall biosynthesis